MTTEQLVHAALNNAWEGGNQEFIRTTTPENIAADLTTCDADLEDFLPEDLLPHVRSWLASKCVAPHSEPC